jgi:phosphoribosylamine--glycine ligase
MPMKFLMVSECGEGAGVLKIIADEGNDCRIYINDPCYRNVYDGLLDKAKKIDPKKGEIIIFDFSSFGKIADNLKKSGALVVGASSFADALEQDRKFGFDVMEEAGIKIPLTAEFEDFNDVSEYLDANCEKDDGTERRFVFKPSGKLLPCHLTYVSKDRGDLEEYTKYVRDNYSKNIESFVLQEFVEGVVVSSELWCDGTKFLRPGNHTLEVKALMNGNLGPATGCAGNLVYTEEGPCRIINQGIAKAEAACVKAGHVGPVDLNTVVNEEGVWALEWTPRFGYCATPTQMFLMKNSIGQFFADVAKQQASHVPMTDKYAAGVRLSIPPYPLEPKNTDQVQVVRPNVGIPIRGLTEANAGAMYFYEVMLQDGALMHSSGPGLIGCAMGLGDSPYEAFQQPYRILDSLKIPEKQYRTDLCGVLCDMYYDAERHDNVSLGSLFDQLGEES